MIWCSSPAVTSGSEMLLLLALAGLICHFSCETLLGATAVTRNDYNRLKNFDKKQDVYCYHLQIIPLEENQPKKVQEELFIGFGSANRKTGLKEEYDIREAMCSENKLFPGEERLCGGQAYIPEEATCCIVEDGDTKTDVTEGISAQVSSCCGLKAYDELNEMCCQSTVVSKPAVNAKCCGQNAINKDTHLCCGAKGNKTILSRKSFDYLCCGNKLFNHKTECCCVLNNSLEIRDRGSSCCEEEESAFCGPKTYNTVEELCCELTVVAKRAPNAQCCDRNAFDKDSELCCGAKGNKTILKRESRDYLCCGNKLFNNKTECCCLLNNSLEIRNRGSSCCEDEESSVQQQKLTSQMSCTEPNTSLCGSTCYNPRNFLCCEKNPRGSQRICSPGQYAKAPTVYNPKTHVCCDGSLSEKKAQGNQRCCGTGAHRPHTEICCNGHRHFKTENTHCCGVKAYNIKDPQMKCCAGTLHNLTLVGYDAQCCGSILETPQKTVCCSDEDREVLYSAKTGFGCCGHRYYNASLWSCCAGSLNPLPHPGQRQSQGIIEVKLLSVNNLNESHLCYEMHIGIVESVGPNSIAFRSVLKIHGRKATVTPLASPVILPTPDRCSFPKVIPGKFYFFDKVHVFSDFNHDSILLSLHSLISKCYHP